MSFFFYRNKPYIAIIADIKNSKNIEDRYQVQEKTQEILNTINTTYDASVASNFTITLGDEFQGLLSDGKNTMKIIHEIERKMHPVKLRFGIGIGEITTKINSNMSIGADGPGYYNARKAIEFLKSNEKKKRTTTSVRIDVEGEENSKQVQLLNTSLTLMGIISERWTFRQREIIYHMLDFKENQSTVAKRLRISQSTVQQSLASSHFYAYLDALETIESIFGELENECV